MADTNASRTIAYRRRPIPQLVEVTAHDTFVELGGDESVTHIHRPARVARGSSPGGLMALGTGDLISRYQVQRCIGQGTFGIVYEARDTHLDRLVALKVLSPAHAVVPSIVARFVQEGRAAARVSHPGIVTVYECGEERGTAYIAMELLQGESLAARVARSGALTVTDAMEITRQIAAALDAAHEQGIVHRDLKPDNIFLVPDPATPSGERVKVLDFGLAKLRDLPIGGQHTQHNQSFGTPRYMAPEQARSAGDVDRRADVYALGCILFELVCGRAPFEGDLLALVDQHQRTRAPRARAFAPTLPAVLDAVIARMLEKAPAARPATMAAVIQELQGAGALVPGCAATLLPGPSPVSGLRRLTGQALIPTMAPIALAPILAAAPAVVFGPATGMIPLPAPEIAVALPVIDAPRPRRRAPYAIAAAIVAIAAIAAMTTVALRAQAAADAAPALARP